MTDIVENIIWLRRRANISQQQLAEDFNIKRTTLSAYEQGKARPSIELLKKYATYFKVPLDEIISGKTKKEQLPEKEDKFKILALTVDNDGNENIEYVPIPAYAGYALGYGDPEYLADLPKFKLPFMTGGTFRAFEVQGDSMLPIPTGSVLIGQYVESVKDLKPGETYVFITVNHGILFKRVGFVDNQKIGLKSDNPIYHSYDMPLMEINEIWKTKLYMSYHFPDPEKSLERIEKGVDSLRDEVKRMRIN
jgi:transcriptional regulator with XRE-family HTH domain